MHELQQTSKKSTIFSKKREIEFFTYILNRLFNLLSNNHMKPMFSKVGQQAKFKAMTKLLNLFLDNILFKIIIDFLFVMLIII